ncbi:MAG: 50S ribosomal protein L6 [bacterium]
MSRLGKYPIEIPSGIKVSKENEKVIVQGLKGSLERNILGHVDIEIENEKIWVKRKSDSKQDKAYHGLYRALIINMIIGINIGFKKYLQINGLGYKAEIKAEKLVLNLGFSHPVEVDIPLGIKISVEEKGTSVCVEGIDKELVGKISAFIKSLKKPEPYKGKGIIYKGERIRRKVGKTGAA